MSIIIIIIIAVCLMCCCCVEHVVCCPVLLVNPLAWVAFPIRLQYTIKTQRCDSILQNL